jgi:hypothetical protein
MLRIIKKVDGIIERFLLQEMMSGYYADEIICMDENACRVLIIQPKRSFQPDLLSMI